MNSNAIVQKLWRLCTVLRKDGITYQQYVTELTYLLFLKMMAERNRETGSLPKTMRWADLVAENGLRKLEHYRKVLVTLGATSTRLEKDDALVLPPGDNATPEERKRYADARPLPDMVQEIFDNASTFIREPQNLTTLVTAIDELDWFSEERDQFGDLYEGLLQKNAEETKRGAGQYFTPRVLIELLVRLMQPKPGEVIQDPAAGTGGFLIAADRYMRARTDNYFELGEKEQEFQKRHAIHGMENVPGTLRLLLMNLYLHDIDSDHVDLGDTLSDKGKGLGRANLILTNPPFGPAGGAPTRDDLSVTATVSSYQLPFVEHCIRALEPGGRAAIVVPDNVLFEDGRGKQLRQMMMDWCDLHTILRLPTGIFYAQGVKTNVIFLTRGKTETGNTKAVWIYDLRAQMPKFGKTTPLTEAHFEGFKRAFGTNPYGTERDPDESEIGRWRQFTRDDIAKRGDNLDIAWLHEAEDEAEEGLTEPDDIAAAILGHLQAATLEIEALMAQAVLSKAFSGELGRKDLGSLVSRIKAGKNLRCEERPPRPHEKGVVKVSAVTWGEFRADQSKTLPIDFEPHEDTRIRSGDFLFSRANTIELVGAVVIVAEAPDNLYLSDKILRLEFNEPIEDWLLWYLRSPMGREGLMNISSGNQLSMRNIGQKNLLSLSIPYPDAAMRTEIIHGIESAFVKIDRLAAEARGALDLVGKLEKAILAKAFRGELVPQDESDEPASLLMERIRAEQEATPKAKRERGRR